MINLETILSLFNDKGTLLQWLKKVEAALNNATLSRVTISQPTADTAKLTFNFEDGTTLNSETLKLPAGPQGPAGATGATGPQGPVGKAGNNITGVTTLGNRPGSGQYLGYTETMLSIHTNEENFPLSVYAKNGADGSGSQARLYWHTLFMDITVTPADTNEEELYSCVGPSYYSYSDEPNTLSLPKILNRRGEYFGPIYDSQSTSLIPAGYIYITAADNETFEGAIARINKSGAVRWVDITNSSPYTVTRDNIYPIE